MSARKEKLVSKLETQNGKQNKRSLSNMKPSIIYKTKALKSQSSYFKASKYGGVSYVASVEDT